MQSLNRVLHPMALAISLVFSFQLFLEPIAQARELEGISTEMQRRVVDVASFFDQAESLDEVLESSFFQKSEGASCPKNPGLVKRVTRALALCAASSIKNYIRDRVPEGADAVHWPERITSQSTLLGHRPSGEPIYSKVQVLFDEENAIALEKASNGSGVHFLIGGLDEPMSQLNLLRTMISPQKRDAFLERLVEAKSHQEASLFERLLGIQSAYAFSTALKVFFVLVVLVNVLNAIAQTSNAYAVIARNNFLDDLEEAKNSASIYASDEFPSERDPSEIEIEDLVTFSSEYGTWVSDAFLLGDDMSIGVFRLQREQREQIFNDYALYLENRPVAMYWSDGEDILIDALENSIRIARDEERTIAFGAIETGLHLMNLRDHGVSPEVRQRAEEILDRNSVFFR